MKTSFAESFLLPVRPTPRGMGFGSENLAKGERNERTTKGT